MAPRPRQATDEQILAGALRAITRIGPGRLTLAHVASEVGISPAALVQRFGSKRGLLLAVAARGADANRWTVRALREAHRSPVAAILALADCWAQTGSTPEEIANSLAFLQIDLTDPAFRALARESSMVVHDAVQQLITEAVQARELVGCNPDSVAWAVQASMSGSLLTWAIHCDRPLADWIRRDLQTLLDPFVPATQRRRISDAAAEKARRRKVAR